MRRSVSRVRVSVAARVSDILEFLGLAGLAVSVAGLTGNHWWGAFTGSVALIVMGVLTTPGRGSGTRS